MDFLALTARLKYGIFIENNRSVKRWSEMMARQTEIKFPIDFFGMEELGQAIKKVRKLRGLTQRELAMRTNTSEKFISNVENGKDTAQLGKVLLLVRILDMGTRLIDLRTNE